MLAKNTAAILKNSKAFSLIEVLVTLTLLALAMTFIGGQVLERLEEGRVSSTKIQIQSLAQLLEDYRRVCFNYPNAEQGLEALISKSTSAPDCKAYPERGFLNKPKLPVDAWDRPFQYESDGSTFTITSFGRNGQPGGSGPDTDLTNKD